MLFFIFESTALNTIFLFEVAFFEPIFMDEKSSLLEICSFGTYGLSLLLVLIFILSLISVALASSMDNFRFE